MKILFKKEYLILTICLGVFISSLVFCHKVIADTNIDATDHWAWNDSIGWIDFYSTNTVLVLPHEVQGYGRYSVNGDGAAPWSYVALNCDSTPDGNICTDVNFSVINDGDGTLSGWAWNDSIGWISFNCNNEAGACDEAQYEVQIVVGSDDPDRGDWTGWAWNDVVGWISFNCDHSSESGGENYCGEVDYRTKTTWIAEASSGTLDSSTYDTEEVDGAAFNSILWKGTLNNGSVEFQLASSNCANGAVDSPPEGGIYPLPEGSEYCQTRIGWGTDNKLTTDTDGVFFGPTSTDDYYTPSGPEVATPLFPVSVGLELANYNKRFFRYRILISTDIRQTQTPIVEEVIVNWSP